MTTQQLGSEGFKWFFGTVEDREDPLKMGRCRIRIPTVHDVEISMKIPTSELPWAVCLNPPFSASLNGVGLSTTGPMVGTTVFGFFVDGHESQIPVIIGTLPGMTKEGKRDIPIETIGTEQIQKIPTGNEPQSQYKARYPYNKVFRSESGHLFEVDDTPNFERTHQYHKSGTYTEINAQGTEVHKVVGDSFEVVVQDKNVYVSGVCNLITAGDVYYSIGGNFNVDVGGSMNLTVHGDVNTRYEGNTGEFFGGNHLVRKRSGGSDLSCPSDIRITGTSCSEVPVAIKKG